MTSIEVLHQSTMGTPDECTKMFQFDSMNEFHKGIMKYRRNHREGFKLRCWDAWFNIRNIVVTTERDSNSSVGMLGSTLER